MTEVVECITAETINASGGIASSITVPPLLADTITMSESLTHGLLALFTSQASVSAQLFGARVNLLNVSMAFGATVTQTAQAKNLLSAKARVGASLHSIIGDRMDDQGEVGAGIADQVTSLLRAPAIQVRALAMPITLIDMLTDSAAVSASISSRFYELIVAGTVEVSAVTLPTTLTDALVADSVEVSGQAIAFAEVTDLRLAAPVSVSASVFGTMTGGNLLNDTAAAYGEVIDAARTVAWTALIETFGMSRYDQPSLNSVAAAGTKMLAFGAGGGYLRAGTTDAGTPFTHRVSTGLMDFGKQVFKRPSEVYVDYTCDGVFRLDLGATRVADQQNGQEQTSTYDQPDRAWTGPSTCRFKPGRGIESPYFRVTFTSVGATEFRLRGVRFTYHPSSRRV